MFIKIKNGEYWVFSSKKASLHCMPWYKSKSIKEIKIKYAKKLINFKMNYKKQRQLRADKLNVKITYVTD